MQIAFNFFAELDCLFFYHLDFIDFDQFSLFKWEAKLQLHITIYLFVWAAVKEGGEAKNEHKIREL